MIDISRTTRYADFPLNTADPNLEGKTIDDTVEVKLYEVELAARYGATR